MTVFNYTALGADGRPIRGSIPAESRAAAIAAVVSKGLHPVEVREENGKAKVNGAKNPAAPSRFTRGGRVTPRQVEGFTRELASLLAGGVPLARSLFLLRRESKTPAAQALWAEIHDEVVGGTSLADALGAHPKQFSSVYVAMVRAGEAGGFLDVVLNQIAEFRAREQDLKGRLKAALVYPCVLILMAVSVVTFLMVFFIPKFKEMFSAGGQKLPLATQIVMNISALMGSWWGLAGLVLIVIGVLALREHVKTESGRRRMERFLLVLPSVGRVIAYFAMVRFCRMLGTLLGAGVPLVAALKVAKETIGNRTLGDTVAHGIEEVQRGESLARALGAAERLFPGSVVEMIAIAEETARLDKELVRLSVSYESELDRQLRMLVALAEPVLLFVMAAFIGTIVVSMLLPIFNMQQLMK